jgi:hypothetical protein
MISRRAKPPVGTLTIYGVLAAAAGILIQVLSGVDEYPTIPPGPLLLLLAAALVAVGSRWWRPSYCSVRMQMPEPPSGWRSRSDWEPSPALLPRYWGSQPQPLLVPWQRCGTDGKDQRGGSRWP